MKPTTTPQAPFLGRGLGDGRDIGGFSRQLQGAKKGLGLFFAQGLEVGGFLLSHKRSTIGASELNFSVRDGKRWILAAITA